MSKDGELIQQEKQECNAAIHRMESRHGIRSLDGQVDFVGILATPNKEPLGVLEGSSRDQHSGTSAAASLHL